MRKKTMVQAEDAKRFWVANGSILANLRELRHALQTMSDGTFNHHLNVRKNDFANWVADVLKEKVLARHLRSVATREEALTAVARCL